MKIMKKNMLMLLLAIGIMVTGCGSKDEKRKEEITALEEEKSEAEETEKPEEVDKLSFSELEKLEFYFSSGAGGWRTVLRIGSDGSFTGVFSDSDMGAAGDGYPKGTYYYCEFKGNFTTPVKVNDYTYSMRIEDISCANDPETTEIIDEILYYYSTPYGIEGAEEVFIYLPGAPTAELPEAYMGWIRNDLADPDVLQLPFYGLYNAEEQNGFSSYEIRDVLSDYMASVKEQSESIGNYLEHEALTQADMNVKAQELYELWDDALNYLWSELKSTLPEEEFAKLLDEQRAWIAEKEKAVEEAGKEVEGGSLYPLVTYGKAAEITEKRVYELYERIK